MRALRSKERTLPKLPVRAATEVDDAAAGFGRGAVGRRRGVWGLGGGVEPNRNNKNNQKHKNTKHPNPGQPKTAKNNQKQPQTPISNQKQAKHTNNTNT
jgi:hypothetical protein